MSKNKKLSSILAESYTVYFEFIGIIISWLLIAYLFFNDFWKIIVIIIGGLTTWIASKGYDMVSKAANWMSPIIVFAFLACGIVALGELEVNNFSDFIAIWGQGSNPFPGQIKYTFWHVLLWSWFCNAAMHIGMSDLSVFRYAKSANAGWTTAAGMYVGHYMAWIAASLLYAVYLKTPEASAFLADGVAPPVAPGPLAYNALGWFGIFAVILAGWTTANPTIYRSGLAFQAILPKLSISKATVLAGTIATTAGIFPAFAMKLLDFVAVYGFILAPVGAVIVFEYFFADRYGVIKDYSEKNNISFNRPVFFAWLISFIVFFGLVSCSQERQSGVFFKNVKDGDVLSSPINLEFGVEGFELAPSESIGERVGHHHLLVNRDSIMEGAVISGDVNYIHFGDDEIRGTIELESGNYLLTLQFADGVHQISGEKMSALEEITVK